MRIKLIFISMLLASCGGISKLPSFTPHKIDIRQGNLVTPEMRSKLKLGMSRTQVRAALGSPLINDALHANRWDYVYRLELGGKLTEQQRMTVYFDGDVLTRIDDGTMPPQPVVASAVVATPASATFVEAEAVPALPAVSVVPSTALVPEPAAEVSGTHLQAADQTVADAALVWAAAWSARDVEKYLASYAPEFKPANGMSRAAWESQRRQRLSSAQTILVELSDIKVKIQGEHFARVIFKQSYRANKHTNVMSKALEMEKVGDAWLIVSEQAAAM